MAHHLNHLENELALDDNNEPEIDLKAVLTRVLA